MGDQKYVAPMEQNLENFMPNDVDYVDFTPNKPEMEIGLKDGVRKIVIRAEDGELYVGIWTEHSITLSNGGVRD